MNNKGPFPVIRTQGVLRKVAEKVGSRAVWRDDTHWEQGKGCLSHAFRPGYDTDKMPAGMRAASTLWPKPGRDRPRERGIEIAGRNRSLVAGVRPALSSHVAWTVTRLTNKGRFVGRP